MNRAEVIKEIIDKGQGRTDEDGGGGAARFLPLSFRS